MQGKVTPKFEILNIQPNGYSKLISLTTQKIAASKDNQSQEGHT